MTIITLNVKHNYLKSRFFEKRFEETSKISSVKEQIYTMTGTMPAHQELALYKTDTNKVDLVNEDATLQDYGAKSGMEIFVTDTNKFSVAREAGLDDFSKIEKYVMPDEEYDKREGTLRSFLKEKYEKDPAYREEVQERRRRKEMQLQAQIKAIETMEIGMRCELQTPGKNRGEIKYLGEVPELGNGPFVGIQLDEPFGDTDGTMGTVRYFTCSDASTSNRGKYGVFMKPTQIKAGDYPCIDELAGDSDDESSEL